MVLKKKKVWPKELVRIDFDKKKFDFFNIEIVSVGYNDMQVILHSGKLTGKGVSRVHQFKGENAYGDSMNFAYQSLRKKKGEGFIDKEYIVEGLDYAISLEKKDTAREKKSKTISKSIKQCDFCHKEIESSLYQKIEQWARNEGNWDYHKSSPLYKKIACIECQMDKGIFQKKLDNDMNF